MSGDDKTSGSTSDRETDDTSWEDGRESDGLFASVCDSRCILINGDQKISLNKKARKRPGVKMVTLLNTDALYPIGALVGPTASDWVDAQLCPFRRCQYIKDRECRRCHVDGCFRVGVSVSLFGTATKRRQVHIDESIMAFTTGKKHAVWPSSASGPEKEAGPVRNHAPEAPPADVAALIDGPKQHTIPASRIPSQTSVESGGFLAMSIISDPCAAAKNPHADQSQRDVSRPDKWLSDPYMQDTDTQPVSSPSLTNLNNRNDAGTVTPAGIFSPRRRVRLFHLKRLIRA